MKRIRLCIQIVLFSKLLCTCNDQLCNNAASGDREGGSILVLFLSRDTRRRDIYSIFRFASLYHPLSFAI